jgi:hypothetical protein
VPNDALEPLSLAEQRLEAMKVFREKHKGEIITPRMLVDEARAGLWPGAIHDFFDWDDATAGESHRLDQAKTLLRIKINYPITPTQTVRIPITISDPRRGGGSGYISSVEVVTNVELSRLSMIAELHQIRRALFRSQQIAMATQFSDTIGQWLTEKLEEIDIEIGQMESGEIAPSPPQQIKHSPGRRRK